MERGAKLNNNLQISILLVDPDRELAVIIKQVLRSLGFPSIYTAKDGISALEMMGRFTIDLIITDYEMTPMNGIEFIKYLRRNPLSPNHCIPIIMLTAQARKHYVELARDCGMTEFVAKPFTAHDLCSRIVKAIDSPRDFVSTPVYMGPDRRRKKTPAELEEERRAGKKEIVMIENIPEQIMHANKNEDVFVIKNDNRIKEKLGSFKSAAELFSAESIKEAQEVINNARGNFIDWFVNDIELLEKLFASAAQDKLSAVHEIAQTSLQIKARAGTFGYGLASKVAYNLHLICADAKTIEAFRLVVIRKHIDALYVIVRRNILGDGGEIGLELLDGLNYIGNKYKTS